jgi:hypothetical protein
MSNTIADEISYLENLAKETGELNKWIKYCMNV